MIKTNIQQRNARRIRREAPTHSLEIGQSVRLKGGLGLPSQATDIFYITATLPPNGSEPQYRIRNDEERYERVTTQDSLEPVDASQAAAGATLIERTFGHGQGAETQQSRNQKAEAGEGAAQA